MWKVNSNIVGIDSNILEHQLWKLAMELSVNKFE